MNTPLPYLTSACPGTGGVLRTEADDFCVHEIPLYELSGTGEHLFVEIEKRNIPTISAVNRLARRLNVRVRDVGYAGLKDARAVTRQWLSFPGVDAAALEDITEDNIRILESTRHTNKLKVGHLAGNRFVLTVRKVGDDALARAGAVLDVLAARGVPNYYGPQRFGSGGNNHLVGAALLAGDFTETVQQFLGAEHPADAGVANAEPPAVQQARAFFRAGDTAAALEVMPKHYAAERKLLAQLVKGREARKAWREVPKKTRLFMLHAFQSHVFNRSIAERMDALDAIWLGDLAWLHGRGAVFSVKDLEAEAPRCAAFEISPSGPLFGYRMTTPTGAQAEIEQAALAEWNITPRAFAASDALHIKGERRPLRVPVTDPQVCTVDSGAVQISFSLPAGSFATSVMREVMKVEV